MRIGNLKSEYLVSENEQENCKLEPELVKIDSSVEIRIGETYVVYEEFLFL